jgi:hypothetical protein
MLEVEGAFDRKQWHASRRHLIRKPMDFRCLFAF